MNRREFLRLGGTFVAGAMIQPQIPINWFYEPPARPVLMMPTRYVLTDRWGEQFAEGCFDNFIYCNGHGTHWTEVELPPDGWHHIAISGNCCQLTIVMSPSDKNHLSLQEAFDLVSLDR